MGEPRNLAEIHADHRLDAYPRLFHDRNLGLPRRDFEPSHSLATPWINEISSCKGVKIYEGYHVLPDRMQILYEGTHASVEAQQRAQSTYFVHNLVVRP